MRGATSKSDPVAPASNPPGAVPAAAGPPPVDLATELVRSIRGHPQFPSAVRDSTAILVEEHARNRLLTRLISDRGRAQFGILALYLHFHDDAGLTPSRMADLAAEVGICSRGRVKALLVLLRWAGHVEPAPVFSDRRRRPLVPTEKMKGAYRQRWRRQLEIIARMVPEAGVVARSLDDPIVFGAFAVAAGAIIRSGFRILDHCSASAAPAPIAGGEAFPVSISALASAVRVSRSHALNLLREAERVGLVERPPQRSQAEGIVLRCTPLLAGSLAGFFSATYAVMAAAALEVSARARP